MKYTFLLFLPLLFFQTCNATKDLQKQHSDKLLKERIEEYVNCLNDRDQVCLQNLYSKNYESLSPVNQPQDLTIFINQLIQNLEKHHLQVAIQIKEIQSNESLGFVVMNWQLKPDDTSLDTDPFANVQRMDIWKKDSGTEWLLFRTIIYNERAF